MIMDPANKDPEPVQDDALSKFRDEMAQQFADLKAETQAKIDELTKENEKLVEENKQLNRALVRSAIVPAPEPVEVLSPEEKAEREYTQEVKNIFEKSLRYSGRTINGN